MLTPSTISIMHIRQLRKILCSQLMYSGCVRDIVYICVSVKFLFYQKQSICFSICIVEHFN